MDDTAKHTIERMLAFWQRFRYNGATSHRTESHRDGRWRTGHLPWWDKLWAKLVRAPNFAFIIMFLCDNFGNLPLRHFPARAGHFVPVTVKPAASQGFVLA